MGMSYSAGSGTRLRLGLGAKWARRGGVFVRSRSPRSGVGGGFAACGRTGDGDSSAKASSARFTPVMREPGAWDEATGVSGASHGGVAATRGVEARPRSDDATLLRALSLRSASASARSRMAVGSLFFGVVGVCGSLPSHLKHCVSSLARLIVFMAGAAELLNLANFVLIARRLRRVGSQRRRVDVRGSGSCCVLRAGTARGDTAVKTQI